MMKLKLAALIGIIVLGVLYYYIDPLKEQSATTGSQSTKSPQSNSSSKSPPSATGNLQGVRFTKGLAKVTNPGIVSCKGGRVSALGEITSEDGSKWVVPSNVNLSLNDASDLSNRCTGVEYKNIADVDLYSIPVVEIDSDGVIITGYIFADNYFELYVNGKPVAKDPVPFTPFNASIVRFKAKYPMTYAIKAVDWEENLGVGTEDNRGNKYHFGDAGFVGVFSDGTVTDESWKAQNYYIAPLMSKEDVVIEIKDGKEVRAASNYSEPPACDANCYAAHFAIPDNWFAVDFDDSTWPNAWTYSEDAVGVDNKSEYTNFRDEFGKGKFIWTNNLNLDNEILLRHTVQGK
ncbi:hypothetical protein [Cohnella silvisoli]|uniref:Uncharacterized protein n=1 Tax=Cohnella silvisoli TaxID=2873699 RepID=A0ABV1KSX6_9BACL|nr:hypothetical protein [Cohnella silvisoli]MCD9021748.1 hypothetical protein [Cohnella silvisoli]